jgi:hypothetical protein
MRYRVAAFFSLFLGQSLAIAEAPDANSLVQVQAALESLDATNLDDDWYFTMEVQLSMVKSCK